MSPVTEGSQDPDSQHWQWFRIEDFTPGCYDASNVATDTPLIEAPLGAGNATGTFCCMALRAGGLGPLPKMVQSYTWEVTFPLAVTTLYLVGAAVVPSIGSTSQPVVIVEGDNGTTHYWIAYALDLTSNVLSIIHTIQAAHQTGIFGSPYPFFTRASNTSTPQLHAGTPILVFPASIANDPNATSGHVFVYPTPTHRATYGVKDLVTPGTQITGQTLGYANRILVLSGIGYTWPAGSFGVNENIAFTTPPNGYALGNQQTVLAAETPFGFGAWGSVSTGELVLIKKQGGGVVVNGDIEAPSSVLYLPGIQPIGNFVGKAAAAQAGLYYCSEDRGAWLWNGGNTSQKISQPLRDAFYDVTSGVIASNNYGFFCARWGAWMLFSGNWLFNPTQGGWWPLYPQKTKGNGHVTGHNFFWFNQGTFGYQMWASPIEITSATKLWLFRFDNRVDAPHWQWTSLPIHVSPTGNHVVDVRQVIVRASCGSAGGTVTVTIGSWSDTSSAGAIGLSPQPIRFNVGLGGVGLDDIVIEVTGDQTTATSASPIVHSIDVAYQLRAHVASDN